MDREVTSRLTGARSGAVVACAEPWSALVAPETVPSRESGDLDRGEAAA